MYFLRNDAIFVEAFTPGGGESKCQAAETPLEDIQMIASPPPLVIVIAAIVVLGVTGNLFALSPIVITVQAAAVVLNVWARTWFQRGTFRVTAAPSGAPIITRGPYRFIRIQCMPRCWFSSGRVSPAMCPY